MILTVLYFAAIVLCVLGLTEVVFLIKLCFLAPENKTNNYLTVVLTKEDYYFQILCAVHKLKWYGSGMFDGIIALTDGLSTEELRLCERLCFENGFCRLILCKREELCRIIDNLNKQDE